MVVKQHIIRLDRYVGIGHRRPRRVQQPVGRVGKPEDIAALATFFCSEPADFITGENICLDGGMTKMMIYHGEHGWSYDGEEA